MMESAVTIRLGLHQSFLGLGRFCRLGTTSLYRAEDGGAAVDRKGLSRDAYIGVAVTHEHGIEEVPVR